MENQKDCLCEKPSPIKTREFVVCQQCGCTIGTLYSYIPRNKEYDPEYFPKQKGSWIPKTYYEGTNRISNENIQRISALHSSKESRLQHLTQRVFFINLLKQHVHISKTAFHEIKKILEREQEKMMKKQTKSRFGRISNYHHFILTLVYVFSIRERTPLSLREIIGLSKELCNTPLPKRIFLKYLSYIRDEYGKKFFRKELDVVAYVNKNITKFILFLQQRLANKKTKKFHVDLVSYEKTLRERCLAFTENIHDRSGRDPSILVAAFIYIAEKQLAKEQARAQLFTQRELVNVFGFCEVSLRSACKLIED